MADAASPEADDDGYVSMVRGDAYALAALRGEGADWDRAAKAYAAALEVAPARLLPRLLNNYGVALARSGHRDESLRRWRQAIALESPQKWVPRTNLGLATSAPGLARRISLQSIADGGDVRGVFWAHLAQAALDTGDPKYAAQMAGKALDDIRTTHVISSRRTWGGRGALMASNFQLGIGLGSTTVDYALTLEVSSEPWLIAPTPLDEAALEKLVPKK